MSASPRPSRSRASAHECPAQQRPPHKRQSSKRDRKSTRLNSSHRQISYAVFCLKKNSEVGPHEPAAREVGALEVNAREVEPREILAGEVGERLRAGAGEGGECPDARACLLRSEQ